MTQWRNSPGFHAVFALTLVVLVNDTGSGGTLDSTSVKIVVAPSHGCPAKEAEDR